MPRATAGAGSRAGWGVPADRRAGRPRPSSRPAEPAAQRRPRRNKARPAVVAASGPEPGLAGLSHLDRRGKARMVDVSAKLDTVREARARVTLRLQPATLRAIRRGEVVKGDVLGVARLAGIMAAKRTAELIPLCHPLRLTGIDVRFVLDRARSAVHVETAVRTVDKTGVEMEALTAAAGAGLAIYDMVKAIDRGMRLTDLCLVEKSGGRSGHWVRR
jgi:cyclic pyranopterin phosphate synthase